MTIATSGRTAWRTRTRHRVPERTTRVPNARLADRRATRGSPRRPRVLRPCTRVLRPCSARCASAPVTRVEPPCTERVDAVPGPAGPGRVPRSPVLVGRGAELATARGLVDAVAAGRGGALLVAGRGRDREDPPARRGGRAGRGARAARAVRAGGAGRGDVPGGRRRGDRPPRRPGPGPEPRRCAPTAPRSPGCCPAGRRPDGGIGTPPSADPVVVLAEGLLRLLRLALGDAPGCVLRLEDLHWADDDTLALVEHLASAAADSPVLLACSARDDAPAHAARRLAAAPGTITLHLARLGGRDVAALAAACRGGRPGHRRGGRAPAAPLRRAAVRGRGAARRAGLGGPAHARRARRRPARGAARARPRRSCTPPPCSAPSSTGGCSPRRPPASEPEVLRALRAAVGQALLVADGPGAALAARAHPGRGARDPAATGARGAGRAGGPGARRARRARTTSRAPPSCSSRRARRTPR